MLPAGCQVEQSPCRGLSSQTLCSVELECLGMVHQGDLSLRIGTSNSPSVCRTMASVHLAFVTLARVEEGHVCHNTCGGQRTASGVDPCLRLCSRQGLIVIHRVDGRLAAAGSQKLSPPPISRWSAGMTPMSSFSVGSRNSNPGCLACSAITSPTGLPLQPIPVPPFRLTVPKRWRPSANSVLRSPER